MKNLFRVVLALSALVLLTACGGGGGGGGSGAGSAVAPTLSVFNGSVDENSAYGTVVGTMSVDDGGSAVTSIVLDGVGAADFNIANNGEITVTGAVDYESRSAYALTATATNSVGSSAAVAVNITVNDISEASVPSLSAFSAEVDENSPAGTAVGTLSLDDGGSVVTSIVLSGTGSDHFTVETNGTLVVASGATLDYETRSGYTLQAVATNGVGSSSATTVTVSLKNLYDVVLKTGQSISYNSSGAADSSVKDDGFYQAGMARSYTRSGEIVIVNSTGLMWQDDNDAAASTYKWVEQDAYDLGNYSDTSGSTAMTYCSQKVLGGYDDWRLPTMRELTSILDLSRSNPAINATFVNTAGGGYWTSSTYVASTRYAWYIYFPYGADNVQNKYGTFYVRCVRGGE